MCPVTTRIALATCEQLPDLDPDDQPLINLFRKIGIEAAPAIWSDSSIDWTLFDQIIIRNTWDYTNRLEEFLAWAKSNKSRIRNSFETIRWNSDKIYLKDLASAGFPVVDTQFVSGADSDWDPPNTADFVVKPTVSAGSQDTMRFPADRPGSKHNAQGIQGITTN